MTLDELKAEWEKAVAEAAKDPSNKELAKEAEEAKSAYDEAKAEADAEAAKGKKKDEPDPEVDPDEAKLDEKTKGYLKKLRDENAKHRTKNKELASKLKVTDDQKKAILKAIGIETEDETPEEKIKKLSNDSQNLATRNAILESAVHYGIVGDDLDFYEFLVGKAAGELEDGDELSEEQLNEIVQKVKKSGSGKSGNTSVGKGKDGKPPPKPGDAGVVTLTEFLKMGVIAKSKLFEKTPEVYNALLAEAKASKKSLI